MVLSVVDGYQRFEGTYCLHLQNMLSDIISIQKYDKCHGSWDENQNFL
jgi:hypothetical protein